MKVKDIKNVLILGSGRMGQQIGLVSAMHGFNVIMYDISQEFIDNAVMIQYRHLRILHGKGNGILRQMIRQYLESTGTVREARDERVENGGAGITVIEMDF